MAVNCWFWPRGTEAAAGATWTDCRVGATAVTVIDPFPVTPDNVALMVAEPVARLVAKPKPEIVATLVFDESQVAELVRSSVDPSL